MNANDTALIEGYESIAISDGKLDLSSIVDNSCVEILANGILDLFSLDQIEAVLRAIVSKLRLGGRLVIGGTDIDLFAALVNYKEMKPEEANAIVREVSSMTSHKQVRDLLGQMGLEIFSVVLSNANYEVTAKRK